MSVKKTVTETGKNDTLEILKHYGCGPVKFTGDDGLYERHLIFDKVINLSS